MGKEGDDDDEEGTDEDKDGDRARKGAASGGGDGGRKGAKEEADGDEGGKGRNEMGRRGGNGGATRKSSRSLRSCLSPLLLRLALPIVALVLLLLVSHFSIPRAYRTMLPVRIAGA